MSKMKDWNFRKYISIVNFGIIVIIVLTIILTGICLNDIWDTQIIGKDIIICDENKSSTIKSILQENNVKSKTVENFNIPELTIKKVTTWLDFNNQRYIVEYELNGTISEYEFSNDNIGELKEYVAENKITDDFNYKYLYIMCLTIIILLIVTKIVLKIIKNNYWNKIIIVGYENDNKIRTILLSNNIEFLANEEIDELKLKKHKIGNEADLKIYYIGEDRKAHIKKYEIYNYEEFYNI